MVRSGGCVARLKKLINLRQRINLCQIKSWQRSKGVIVTNEYNEVPSISYQEEVIVTTPDDKIISKTDVGVLNVDLSNTDIEFPLLNTLTNEVVGTMKYSDLYVIMYSHYMHLAGIRDSQPVA